MQAYSSLRLKALDPQESAMANWKLKVLVQFSLAHLSFGERLNHALQLVNRSKAARKREILEALPTLGAGLALIRKHVDLQGASVVEVGTGWLPLPTTLLHLAGAGRIVTYDHQRHVRYTLVREMIEVFSTNRRLLANWLRLPEETIAERLARLGKATDLEGFLAAADIEYVAPGDATKTELPDGRTDLFFSYAVLEHVSEKVLEGLVLESKRLLRPSGCFYAYVGLHDHYACSDRRISKVNFLKYPEWAWRLFVKNKISYHNRLRERDFLEALQQYGAHVLEVKHVVDPEDVARVKAMKVDSRFDRFTPEECAVTATELVVTFT